MKPNKKFIFTVTAYLLSGLFLLCIWSVAGQGATRWLHEREGDAPRPYAYEETWDPEETEVSGLLIDWVYGGVTLRCSDEHVIRITERADRPLEEDERLEYERDDRALCIRWNGLPSLLGRFGGLEKDLEVTVPRALAGQMEVLACTNRSGAIEAAGMTALELDISSASGAISLREMAGETGSVSSKAGGIDLRDMDFSEELTVKCTTGGARAENVSAGALELKTVSSDVSFAGSAGELTARSVTGRVEAALTACPNTAEMRSVSGDMALLLPKSAGFTAEYSSVSGRFLSTFPEAAGEGRAHSGRVRAGSGAGQFTFATASGNASVDVLDGAFIR